MPKLTLEQEIFCLAQVYANQHIAKIQMSGETYPISRFSQNLANNYRDHMLEFIKDYEKLKAECQAAKI